MKKNTALFILLIFSFSLLLYACVVETHPKVPPPPPKREIVLRCAPGFVWVSGHWAWKHGRYVWVPGHCKKARKGYVWVLVTGRKEEESGCGSLVTGEKFKKKN